MLSIFILANSVFHSNKIKIFQKICFFPIYKIISEEVIHYVKNTFVRWLSTGQTFNMEYHVEIIREFSKRFRRKWPALFKSGRWHFHQDKAPVHNSILVTDYLTKMGINAVPQPLYSPDLAPWDFWLFPKLRGCRYETTEETKEAVTNVIDTFTQEDFHGAFQTFLERYNKSIAPGGD